MLMPRYHQLSVSQNEQRVVRGKAVWSDYNKRYMISTPKTPNAKMGLTVEPIYKLTDGMESCSTSAS